MKICNYVYENQQYAGVLSKDGKSVYSFADLGFHYQDIQQLCDDKNPDKLNDIKQILDRVTIGGTDINEVKFLSPFPEIRRDMICIGFNFKKHAQEVAKLRGESAATADIAYPIYFSKRNATSTGPDDDVPYVKGYAENLDVGVEVCVVIGWDALNITEDEVDQYLLGYTIADDICDTRLNKVYTQPFLGKSIDGYIPLGPWIVTIDEFEKNPLFNMKLMINDYVRQEGNTKDLAFSIPYIVSELTTDMTLKAGTMIATGSPANIDAGNPEKLKINPDDVITCEIDGIGKLANTVKEIKDSEAWL